MTSLNYKKILAAAGIMATLITSWFLFLPPKKAQATVPVEDAVLIADFTEYSAAFDTFSTDNLLNTYNTAWNTANEVAKNVGPVGLPSVSIIGNATSLLSWDSIAYALGKTLLSSLTQSIVNWINSGFEGSPLFITNYEQYLADAFDQGTGIFMKQFLSPDVYNSICSPFRLQLKLALANYNNNSYDFGQRMSCTLGSISNNAINFGDSFNNGGWSAFLTITGSSQNDPYGAYITSFNQMRAQQVATQINAQTKSIYNQGFLSQTTCSQEICDIKTIDSNGNASCAHKTCLSYTTISPGKWISDELSSATGIEFQRLGMADDLNKILSSLIFELFNKLTQGIKS